MDRNKARATEEANSRLERQSRELEAQAKLRHMCERAEPNIDVCVKLVPVESHPNVTVVVEQHWYVPYSEMMNSGIQSHTGSIGTYLTVTYDDEQ